jgi:hypothetical protein
MNTKHLIIGLIGIFCSGAMIYFSQARYIPSIIKPFLFTWWIEDERINRTICLILAIGGAIGSILFIIGGLTSRKMPFP